MQQTTLAILWHMHQPYYRDMITGESTMPWVRFHGTHSYYDMIRIYEKYPTIKATINFVPSLIEQLLAYVEGDKSDVFLDHTIAPADSLTPQQKVFLLRYFFMANADRKIAPYPAYHKLYTRRGLEPSSIDFQQAIRFFSNQDYLDIQVFYNLVWFGFAAKEEIPELGQMLCKDHFTEDDKRFVLEAQRRIIQNLIEGLRSTAMSKNVELCTTPYFHPIMPLLIDTNIALRAVPKAPLPQQLKIPWVAEAQLASALDAMERWTGRRPKGIWPAEGGVCPEMIPMLANAGIAWMATDDRVLGRSKSKPNQDMNQHQPFTTTHAGKKVNIVFRDHSLSDLIGFTYGRMPAGDAVNDFIGHLKRIDAGATTKKLVTVILDGENPWEGYVESGMEFLTALFEAINKEQIPTTTISEYLDNNPPTTVIENLHSGSWIDANYNIWIGKQQKNQAWSYIKRTMDEVGDALGASHRQSDEKAAKAFRSLCAACGSDWFWWYDDDFDSAFKPDFDRLFRLHLKNVFLLMGKDVPIFLFEPIYKFKETTNELAKPQGFMYPVIDGERTSFFEWSNAIRFNVKGRGGAIALSAEPFESISFGFNVESFFVRIDPVDTDDAFDLGDDDKLVFNIHDGNKHYKYALKKSDKSFVVEPMGYEGEPPKKDNPVEWRAGSVLELGVHFDDLGFKAGELLTFTIAIHRHGVEIRRYSHIRFVVPDDTYEQEQWAV